MNYMAELWVYGRAEPVPTWAILPPRGLVWGPGR